MIETKSIIRDIEQMKLDRNAIILAHNYQNPEVQEIADFTGDSLELARKATDVEQEVIVFCGVHFMAETAAIVNPKKKVLLPDPESGCPMADMATGEALRKLKDAHPDAAAICYVNSSAEVKAECDICCTSANAVKVVATVPEGKPIIFVPDMHLGSYIEEQLGRKMILWDGYCPTHDDVDEREIVEAKEKHPNAVAMAHPECPPLIRQRCDKILSTGQMCRYVEESDESEFIVVTEMGLLHRLRKDNPGKVFYHLDPPMRCPNMKKINLEKIRHSLETLQPVINVEEPIRSRALSAIERMLEIVE